jgi:virginiamycin B lyase
MVVLAWCTSLPPLLPGLLVAGLLAGSGPEAGAVAADRDARSVGVSPATFGSVATADIEEWEVPWENSRPRDPWVDGNGRVWFAGQKGDYLAYLTPSNGEFRRFDLPSGTAPYSVLVDERGHAWYAGNRSAHIGRLDPATGEVSEYPMPHVDARDPLSLQFDGRGNIWFTLQGSNMVGRLAMATGEIDLVRIETPNARPYGLDVDASGRPWFSLLGAALIGTVDPVTLELRELELPRSGARTRRIDVDAGGRIWYVDWAQGYLGRFDPSNEGFREWATPNAARARPFGMTLDHRGRVWFVETGVAPNQLTAFDPVAERFFSSEPVEAGIVRHLTFHDTTRDIWFGTDSNLLVRIRVP